MWGGDGNHLQTVKRKQFSLLNRNKCIRDAGKAIKILLRSQITCDIKTNLNKSSHNGKKAKCLIILQKKIFLHEETKKRSTNLGKSPNLINSILPETTRKPMVF